MAISMLEILPIEERNRVVEINSVLTDLIPIAEQLVGEGWPLQKHLASLMDRRTWNDKMIKTFQIPIPLRS